MPVSEALASFARRVGNDPGFLAYWLNLWCERYGRVNIDIRDVARKFHLDTVDLAWIVFLCPPTLTQSDYKRCNNAREGA